MNQFFTCLYVTTGNSGLDKLCLYNHFSVQSSAYTCQNAIDCTHINSESQKQWMVFSVISCTDTECRRLPVFAVFSITDTRGGQRFYFIHLNILGFFAWCHPPLPIIPRQTKAVIREHSSPDIVLAHQEHKDLEK